MENIIRVRDKSFNIEKMETSRNSGGRLDKIWIRDTNDIRYLIKSSTTFGQEPYSEVMAYIIGKVLGFNVLEYQLIEANYFKDRIRKYYGLLK